MKQKNLLFLLSALILTGCGGTSSASSNTTTSTSSSAAVTQKLDPVVTKQSSAKNVNDFVKIKGGPLPFRLYIPDNYDGEKYQYPVFIFLHGAGERGTDNSLQLKHVVQNLFNDLDSPIYQSIGIFPQCPAENDTTDADLNQWVDTPWEKGNYSNDSVPESDDLKAVLKIVEELKNDYSMNEDRIYVMGLSMGGFGTWNLLMNHTEMFAGAVPVCGGADVTYADKLKNMPIYTIHGTSDGVVPFRGTREMVKALKDAGSRSIIYDELRNFDHNVWDYASTKAGIIDWLFSQNRKNHTDVGNDGIYKYVFEAEAADVQVSSKKNAIRFGNTGCYNSGESGTGYLGDYTSAGDKIIFNITSDKASKATLSMRMGLLKNKEFSLVGTSNALFSNISHNGNNFNIDANFKFNKSGVDPDFYIWEEKEVIEVDLIQGENNFVFTTCGGVFNHFDCLSLTTDAKVEWTSEVEKGHNYSDYLITKTPTSTETGTMYRYCKTCCAKEEVYLEKELTNYSPKVERDASEYLGSVTSYTYNDHRFSVLSKPTGTLKDNIIQAESATINGDWDSSVKVNTYATPVKHIQMNGRKGQLVYKFNSSEEATVNLIFSLAANKDFNLMVSDSMKFTLNGKPYALNDINQIPLNSGGWYNFKNVDLGLVDVNKGENTLIVDVLGNFNFNFDYMNLKSVATIA